MSALDSSQSGRQFHGPKDYLDLARSDDATEDELRNLAHSTYLFVVLAVAQHPRTPADALAVAVPAEPSSWNDYSLMAAIARHPHTDEPTLRTLRTRLALEKLREERDAQRLFEAGIALFEQPNTPDDVLMDLINDPGATTEFRKVAARETSHPAIIEHLLQDRSETVRRAAARRAG
jgi:hypothetical protein